MIENLLEYGGIIFAAIGIICLFLEAFEAFKRKYNSKLTIAGLVFLTVSIIGFIVTEIILRDADVSYFFNIAWIALLWAYLICNLVSALLVSRKNRAAKHQQQADQITATVADDSDEIQLIEDQDRKHN